MCITSCCILSLSLACVHRLVAKMITMKHVVRGDTLDLGDMIKTRAAAFKRGGKAGKVLEVYDTKEHFEASSPMAVLHASGKVVRKTPGEEDAVGKARKPSKREDEKLPNLPRRNCTKKLPGLSSKNCTKEPRE